MPVRTKHARTVTGHARCDRVVRLLIRPAAPTGPAPAAAGGQVQCQTPDRVSHSQGHTRRHQFQPGIITEPLGSLTVILADIPPRTTPKTGGVQTDGEANLTSEDDTSRPPMDGWEVTHNWLVPDSTRWTRGCSSVGQSRRLITARSQVRGLPAPLSKTSKGQLMAANR